MSNNNTANNNASATIISGRRTRLSYAQLFEPKGFDGSKPVYSASLIIPKDDKKTLDLIRSAIKAAYEAGAYKLRGNNKNTPALEDINLPLNDGDKKRPNDPAYENSYYINAKNQDQPKLFGLDGEEVMSRSDALPVVSIRKRRDLTSQIEEKEAEIAKLQKRKKAVMQKCGKTDHAGMQEIQQQIAMAKAAIRHVDDRQAAIQGAIAKSKRSFLALLKNPAGYDLDVLEQERLAVRLDAESAMRFEIEEKTGAPIQEQRYADSLDDVKESLALQTKEQPQKHLEKEKKELRKKQEQIR